MTKLQKRLKVQQFKPKQGRIVIFNIIVILFKNNFF